MPINSFWSHRPKNIMSYVAIANFQRLLQEQGYLYFEEIPDGFDYLAFAQKFGSSSHTMANIYSQLGRSESWKSIPLHLLRIEPHTEG